VWPQADLTFSITFDTAGLSDVTSRVRGCTFTRGRQRETDQFEAATGTLTLLDEDRRFDPFNTTGPYYGDLVPWCALVIEHPTAGELFTGYITDWSIDYVGADNIAVVTVPFTDFLGRLAASELDEIAAAYAGDLSGDRVLRVVARDEVFVDPPPFPAGVGLATFGATTLGENCLTYLQRCALSEGGYLYAPRTGGLAFDDRQRAFNQVSTYTFVDAHSATAGIAYTTLTQASTSDLLYNRVTGRSETVGTDRVAHNPASESRYFPRTLPLGDLFVDSNAQVDDLLSWKLERYKDPEARFTGLEINTMTLPTAQVDTVAALEILDIITVKRTPLGTGTEISQICMVDGITHTIGQNTWMTTLNLSNADTRIFFILDESTFGKLDSNRLAF
jgi:hypothetical protein